MKSTIKILSFSLLCFMAGFSAFGQGTMLWEKQVPIPLNQILQNSVQSQSKRFWVGVSESVSNPTGNGSPRVEVVAFSDTSGDTLWRTKLYDLYPVYSYGVGVARGANNHFWIALAFDYGTITTGEKNALSIVEVDSLGQILTVREYFKDCQFMGGISVHEVNDGGVVVIGSIQEIDTCKTGSDLFALRLDSEGNTLWQTIYPLPGGQGSVAARLYPNNKLNIVYNVSSPTAKCAWIDASNGLFLSNVSGPTIATNPPVTYTYPLLNGSYLIVYNRGITGFPTYVVYVNLIYTDSHFNIIWQKEYTSLKALTIPLETTDGGIVMKGKNDTKQTTIVKINQLTGNEVWRRTWPYSSNPVVNYTINGLALASNGDVMVSGSKWASGGGGEDYYMAKLTGVADFLQPSDYCSDSVRANFTGTWLQDTLRLHSTSNSGMAYQDSLDYQWIINGVTVSLDSAFQQIKNSANYPQGLPVSLVITNFWGCKDTLTARVTPQGIVGNRPVVETLHATSLQNARPNPSTQNVTIGYKLPANTKEAVLRVYELGTGRTVAERNLSALEADTKFNVSHWATGVYAYQLFVNGAPVAVKRLVVTR